MEINSCIQLWLKDKNHSIESLGKADKWGFKWYLAYDLKQGWHFEHLSIIGRALRWLSKGAIYSCTVLNGVYPKLKSLENCIPEVCDTKVKIASFWNKKHPSPFPTVNLPIKQNVPVTQFIEETQNVDKHSFETFPALENIHIAIPASKNLKEPTAQQCKNETPITITPLQPLLPQPKNNTPTPLPPPLPQPKNDTKITITPSVRVLPPPIAQKPALSPEELSAKSAQAVTTLRAWIKDEQLINFENLDELLAQIIDLNILIDNQGNTILHEASNNLFQKIKGIFTENVLIPSQKIKQLILCLIKKGADPNITNQNKEMALSMILQTCQAKDFATDYLEEMEAFIKDIHKHYADFMVNFLPKDIANIIASFLSCELPKHDQLTLPKREYTPLNFEKESDILSQKHIVKELTTQEAGILNDLAKRLLGMTIDEIREAILPLSVNALNSSTAVNIFEVAVFTKNLNLVKLLVERGMKDKRSNDKYSLLQRVRFFLTVEIEKYLLQNGAEPIIESVSSRNLSLEDYRYIVHFADINKPIANFEHSPIYNAFYNDRPDIVEYLVSRGADIKGLKCGPYPWEECFFDSIKWKHPNFVKFLLDQNININFQNKFQQTALHIAATQGSRNMIDLLLLYNPDINIKDFMGLSFRDYQIQAEKIIQDYLQSDNHSIRTLKEIFKKSVLYKSMTFSFPDQIMKLIRIDNAIDQKGNTLFHIFAQEPLTESKDLIVEMIECGADLMKKNRAGQTPLSLMEENLAKLGNAEESIAILTAIKDQFNKKQEKPIN